ncbi:MAG: hypothetical protein KAI53_01795 [Candidatus Aenigmarchaeota archaeon]|nr:hypothetical protein [Candidatus Aenigmarchaeota archaeon]
MIEDIIDYISLGNNEVQCTDADDETIGGNLIIKSVFTEKIVVSYMVEGGGESFIWDLKKTYDFLEDIQVIPLQHSMDGKEVEIQIIGP